MARKVKCKICKKQLTTDNSFRITKQNKCGKNINFYYCTEEEYKENQKQIQDKKELLEYISELLNVKIISSAFMKQLNEVLGVYDCTVVKKAFKDQEKNIRWSSEKYFPNEFNKSKYIMAIIKNNIDRVYKKHIKEVKEMEELFSKKDNNIDLEIINIENKQNKKRKVTDISVFLD